MFLDLPVNLKCDQLFELHEFKLPASKIPGALTVHQVSNKCRCELFRYVVRVCDVPGKLIDDSKPIRRCHINFNLDQMLDARASFNRCSLAGSCRALVNDT